jgi:NAD(P)H-flavin reductase
MGTPAGADSIFAIASAPAAGNYFEFLLRRGAPVADALAGLSPGSEVRITPAAGKGFPVEAAKGNDVLLVATGSGISAIRSVVGVVRASRSSFGRTWLLYGARTPAELAYSNEFDAWRQSAFDVTPTVSLSEASWTGKSGWVEKHVPQLRADHTWAFLCGRKEMIRDMTELLVQRGLPTDRISLNY